MGLEDQYEDATGAPQPRTVVEVIAPVRYIYYLAT